MRITSLGDSALIVELGERVDELTHHRVQAAFRILESPPLPGVTEVVPAFTTLTLFYDPLALAEDAEPAASLISRLTDAVRSWLRALPARVEPAPGPIVEIPVCYGGPFGPEQVAVHADLTTEEVVRRHGSALYLVYP